MRSDFCGCLARQRARSKCWKAHADFCTCTLPAFDYQASPVTLDNLVGDIETEAISEIAFRTVERLEEVSKRLFAHAASFVANDNLHHFAVRSGAKPDVAPNGYSLNRVRHDAG